jgi:hypothetical protein
MTFTAGRGHSTTIRATRCAAGGPGRGVTVGPESFSKDAASQAHRPWRVRVQPGRLPTRLAVHRTGGSAPEGFDIHSSPSSPQAPDPGEWKRVAASGTVDRQGRRYYAAPVARPGEPE